MRTGTIHYIWDRLTYDLSEIHAPFSTYPSFGFTPSDEAIIIWATGHLWRVPLITNSFGERISGGPPRIIPFVAHIEKRLAETMHTSVDLVALETQDHQRVRAFKELRVDETGTRAVFQAGGINVLQKMEEVNATEIPSLCKVPECTYHHPSFVPGYPDLVIQARWSNRKLSSFELANVSSGIAVNVAGTPLGKFVAPVISSQFPYRVAFVKTGADLLTGSAIATNQPGIYVGNLLDFPAQPRVENLRFVPSSIDLSIFPANRVQLSFVEDDTALVLEQNLKAHWINLAAGPDEYGAYHSRLLTKGKMTMEVAVSASREHVAFVDYFNVYIAPYTSIKPGEHLWSRPANATRNLARLSLHGGHDITFSADGKTLFWLFGRLSSPSQRFGYSLR